jgi:hypothetical protein
MELELRNSCFVPLVMAGCLFAAAAALGAQQHDADIEELCLARREASGEIMTVETRLASVPALLRIPAKIRQPPIVLWHGFGPPASERALTSQNAVALRDALAPHYAKAGGERRLRLAIVAGLSQGWADSAHAGELHESIAHWFNERS